MGPGTCYSKGRSQVQSTDFKGKDSCRHSNKALYCYHSPYLTTFWGFCHEYRNCLDTVVTEIYEDIQKIQFKKSEKNNDYFNHKTPYNSDL